MDVKEALMMAIENLQTNSIWYEKDTQRDIDIVCNTAKRVETLKAENARLREKETPKVPVKYNNFHICPNCEEVLLPKQNFCDECGQKLDWSSDKN